MFSLVKVLLHFLEKFKDVYCALLPHTQSTLDNSRIFSLG